ncbi:NACHT domain-containing protein [Dyadobacter arcticus]|uniref:Energy-coupling factor transporter ATP-binding protein EcfA2 n=1 Tax=Dyadobacter arcticus TaxID=1078754 RepID=A0ABX0UT80_9BACT|nr:NACHT domain-containing protein [Dyadobacter arcticus]NIJ56176.1 energy-coupling factor transporter ATP-binding protein EcfA2 [Dyadobacter arcticus]
MIEYKLEITNLIMPLVKAFGLVSDEWKNLFNLGIYDYLQAQTEKYYFTNTFIHRSEKVRFDDIYYPVQARYKELCTPFENLDDVFDEYRNITIVGSAGSGKTTLIKHIFLKILKDNQKIPILIELKSINEFKGDFEELVFEKILNTNVKPNQAILTRALRGGSFIFLFDGYDEIFSNKKQEITRQIEMFVDAFPKNNYLISTRPGSGVEGFPRFFDFKVQQLTDSDVNGFVTKLVKDPDRRARMLNIIDNTENYSYLEYLRNPLLLSMFILAFESHPEIPTKKSAFYRNVFDTLYSKHDGQTKSGFAREKMSKLQRDEFEKVLNTVCYLSLIEGEFVFTEEYLSDILRKVKQYTSYDFKVEDMIYDLQTTISILIRDGFEYRFPHRSMQEYFCAQFLSYLPSEKKIKGYKNLINVLEESSTDYSYNLWDICLELDKIGFIKNFILSQLLQHEKELSRDSDDELLEAFIKQLDATFFMREINRSDSQEDEEQDELAIFRTINLNTSIVDFCGVYSYRRFASFPRTSGAENELLALLPAQVPLTRNTALPLKFNSITNRILIKHGICDIIRDYRSAYSQKILEFRDELEREGKSIDEILDL